MSQELGLGEINGHAVGIILKEIVRRAINAIRNERQVFEITKKEGNSGNMDDVFTSADTLAQKIYLRSIQECFPTAGVIAEEDGLNIPAKKGCDVYFTIDPLDGTKAFVRRQSHGVGSMIAMIKDGVVVSAYIGDINTREIYGFRPGSRQVHRITEFNTSEELMFGEKTPLREQYIILRDPESVYSSQSQQLIRGEFKNQIIDGGSIGIWLARLWKREIGAALIPRGYETPWDSSPIAGISLKLGYKFFWPNGGRWQELAPLIPKVKTPRYHDVLIVHENDRADLGI